MVITFVLKTIEGRGKSFPEVRMSDRNPVRNAFVCSTAGGISCPMVDL